MATNNRGGNNRGRRNQNNNPQGHNQYDRGWVDTARERPFTAAAAVGAAAAAGVFLWSRRNQITDQISGLSDQISEWREGSASTGAWDNEDAGSSDSFIASSQPRRGNNKRSQADISAEALTLKETGKATA
jgi:hypothetical protein